MARLLAVQGQDPRGFRLAIRARTSGLTAADVNRALTDERSLVVTWLNRGTLHLVRSEDYPWLQALMTPPLLKRNTRWLAQEGVPPPDAERGVAVVERALAADGPLTRVQLRERIRAAGIRTEGQALVHLLGRACLLGVAIRGPMIGRQHAFALVQDWLGAQPPVDRDAALAELARRYLAGHGPADDRDFAKWTGLPLRDVRAGLGAIAAELEERDGLVDLAGRPAVDELPPPKLLGPYDPLLHGWASRDEIVGRHKSVVTMNGVFRPFALVRGRAAGLWKLMDGEVALEPFGRLMRKDAAALVADGDDVVRFLG